MTKPVTKESGRCSHGAVVIKAGETHPFYVRYGVTIDGKRPCSCCGRFWIGFCEVCR